MIQGRKLKRPSNANQTYPFFERKGLFFNLNSKDRVQVILNINLQIKIRKTGTKKTKNHDPSPFQDSNIIV